MSSPSDHRRAGYNAFYRGGDAHALCPFKGTWSIHKKADWLEGWAKAAKADRDREIEQEAADEAERDKVVEFARLYNLAKADGLIS